MVEFLNEQIDELEKKSEVIYNNYLQNNGITETEQAQTQKKKLGSNIFKAVEIEKNEILKKEAEKKEQERKEKIESKVVNAFKKSDNSSDSSSESLVNRQIISLNLL